VALRLALALQMTDSMARIIVTGGAGFIGSHLCERLLVEGHVVTAIDDLSTGAVDNLADVLEHPCFTLRVGDVAGGELPIADRIYHLACPASPVHYQRDMVRTLRTATLGTACVLDAAERHGARVLIASTSEVYGEPLVHPQPETYWGNVNTYGVRSCYDEGKRCAEAYAFSYRAQRGVDARVVRVFNTYGPRMCREDGRVVSTFVYQALLGEPITVFGDGTQTRSFCYVSDLVDGLVRAMEVPGEHGPINLGNDDERTVGELAALIAELAGARSGVVSAPLPADDPTRRRPAIDRARALLKWSPRVLLEDGLVATIDDARRRLERTKEPTRERDRHWHGLRGTDARSNLG
jgi:UDP-glucuronate decarboxylase